MNTQGEYSFKVRGYECGADGKATFVSLCNYMQEAAGLQAASIHIAKQDFNAEGLDLSWVLTRMRVVIDRYPNWWDEVTVLTFPRSGHKITVFRDYLLRVGDKIIGRATSEWVLIDLKTRKLASIPQRVYDVANDELEPVLGANVLTKLRWPADAQLLAPAETFRARRGEIDINGHVNNVHYVAWLIEALPASAQPIHDFEIVYKSETLAGDSIQTATLESSPGVFLVHAFSPDGHDHALARIACL